MGGTDRCVASYTFTTTSNTATVTGRLKREECKRTKHDSAFSDWKILIGPSDWEDYLLGKEGAEKYRTHNLPNCTSCSGVYELGIAVSRHQARREASRLDPDCIVPVYIGKSDNVRTRLQRYGREGAHLENGCSNSGLHIRENDNVSASKRAGLFTAAFSRGYSIVYRWAPMSDNKAAERTEAQVLEKFDYAWNKGSNGIRRHNDVLHKLDGVSGATHLPAFIRKLQLSLEKQKGVRIKACEPLLLENGSDFHDSFKSTNFLPRIFKFGSSQLKIVSPSLNGGTNTTCGVALGHGSVCIRPPVTGNKRCNEHKGMKVNCANSKLIAKGNSFVKTESMEPCTSRGEEDASICGYILDSGAPCGRKPFQRNKRCLEHKGKRNRGIILQPVSEKNAQWTHAPLIHQNNDVSCGVHLNDGTFCTRQPPVGRKRCEEHKGMRIKMPSSNQLRAEIPSIGIPSIDHSPSCGATLRNGSFCRRNASKGNKRCWQHKGRKS